MPTFVKRTSITDTLRRQKINIFTQPAFSQSCIKDQRGFALIVTLLALVLITAMVVEFSYGVYTGTNNLYNWRDSQRLSIMAKSGVNVVARLLPYVRTEKSYSVGPLEYPVENPFEDFNGSVTVRIEDESAKFYLNSLVDARGQKNDVAHACFVRLLRILSLDRSIADKIRDWILKKWKTGTSGSVANATSCRLLSVDELLLIDGISRKDYDTLLPYVTVYGSSTDNSLRIDINGAEKVVLESLSDSITDELAQRVIEYRKDNPFRDSSDLSRVPGFGNDMGILSGAVTADSAIFAIKATASSGGIKRIIETVFDTDRSRVLYWKEY